MSSGKFCSNLSIHTITRNAIDAIRIMWENMYPVRAALSALLVWSSQGQWYNPEAHWQNRSITDHNEKNKTLTVYIFRGMYSAVITMTSQWSRWRLKTPASRLFTQSFIQTQIKENIKAPSHWPLCGEFTGTGEFPTQMVSNAENVSISWRHHGMFFSHKIGMVHDPLQPSLVMLSS